MNTKRLRIDPRDEERIRKAIKGHFTRLSPAFSTIELSGRELFKILVDHALDSTHDL